MNMKLLVPKKVIADSDTFSSGKDLLDRENFATDLTDVLTSTSEGLVVGLDAKWGEGKTTFAKLWRNKLKADETKCIYFDAFENDYMSDAFYALTSLIHEIVKKEENRHLFNQLKENLTSLSKVVLKAGLKSGAKVLTENIAVKAGATFVEELDNATTKYIDERFESSESDKKVVENFKVFLSSLHEKLETDKPIVFIIDELDRCRPNYAMEILETIKHFLSVPNISWILVMNRVQLEQSVSHLYGLDKESCHSYLQKFVQLWVTLPQSTGGIANKVTYFRHCLNDMGLTHHYEDDSLEIHLINHYDLSLREIEQVLTNFAILENRFIGGKGFVGNTFPLYLAIIRVKFKNEFTKILENRARFDEIKESTEIDSLVMEHWGDERWLNPILMALQYCLGTQSQKDGIEQAVDNRMQLGTGISELNSMTKLLASFQLR